MLVFIFIKKSKSWPGSLFYLSILMLKNTSLATRLVSILLTIGILLLSSFIQKKRDHVGGYWRLDHLPK